MESVSICLPIFNGGEFLSDALISLEKQTCKDFVVFISDDGSTDDSVSILENFISKSSIETKFFKNSGLGIAENCNFLAHKAEGKYLKFLFQDDLLEPSCVETFIFYAKRFDDISFAFSDREIIFENRSNKECQDIFNGCRDLAKQWSNIQESQPGSKLLEDPNLLKGAINKIGEPSNTFILRKVFIESGGFDRQFSQLLDVDLWFRLMSSGNVIYINENLSKFRIHDSQQSVINSKENRIHGDFLKLYSKVLTSKHFSSLSDDFRNQFFEATKPLISAGLLKSERNEYLSDINALSQRIKFMEGTFSWKLRKELMKVYYLFNSRQKKIKQPKFYETLNFRTFGLIDFQKPLNPKVSIIIPFFNQHEITWLCLKALELNCDHHIDFEVILVDDFSEKNNDFNNSIKGVQLIRNIENLGFLKSCNEAVRAARGDYIVFLNNDTQVQKGWLTSLIKVLENNSEVGAVGSKLIYPNNRLQEAGGIIWNDASGCNYGKERDHNLPQYNFLREVDYCSGASLAISKSFFLELGEFDEKYSPAYFEDTDLCFKVRERGKKVVYQPKSVVIHLEGTSCGKSEGSGIKAYQKKNRETFFNFWQEQLSQHFSPTGNFTSQYQAANRLNGKKTILVIDSSLPYYDKESGGHRIYQILKILKKQNYHVIFLPANEIADEPYSSRLSFLGVEVLVDESGKLSSEELLKERLNIIDLAWICRPQMFEKFGNFIRKKSNATILYDTIDLHYLRLKRKWQLNESSDIKLKKKWKSYLKKEKKFSKQSEVVLTVTKDEAEIVKTWGVKNVNVLPNIHVPRNDEIPPFSAREGILFIGSYLHPPNVDAVQFLVNEIMPKVWGTFPEMPVTLLGSNPNHEVIDLSSDMVTVTGFIEDVAPYFDLAKVFVSPLRYGAGMKGKIGQSMSLGLPVVTTSIGAEGMDLENGKNALIADESLKIASSIESLTKDEAMWMNLSKEGTNLVNKFSPEAVSKQVAEILTFK